MNKVNPKEYKVKVPGSSGSPKVKKSNNKYYRKLFREMRKGSPRI